MIFEPILHKFSNCSQCKHCKKPKGNFPLTSAFCYKKNIYLSRQKLREDFFIYRDETHHGMPITQCRFFSRRF